MCFWIKCISLYFDCRVCLGIKCRINEYICTYYYLAIKYTIYCRLLYCRLLYCRLFIIHQCIIFRLPCVFLLIKCITLYLDCRVCLCIKCGKNEYTCIYALYIDVLCFGCHVSEREWRTNVQICINVLYFDYRVRFRIAFFKYIF